MSSDQRSVLVIGPSWVGDLVLAQAFFMALRDRGVAAVDVVTPPGPFPLLERCLLYTSDAADDDTIV